jgi:hypothetical protein
MLTQDVALSIQFLEALDPKGVFTFQTIPEREDVKTGASTAALTRILHGTLGEHWYELVRLNTAGAGIFVMINEGDGGGRKSSNVIRIRAHFVDLDGAPLTPVLAASEKPHLIVESSPGKWHAYWLVEDCPLEEFKVRQLGFAEKYGGDRNVVDLPRVMRLPGFYHQKTTVPFLTRLAVDA